MITTERLLLEMVVNNEDDFQNLHNIDYFLLMLRVLWMKLYTVLHQVQEEFLLFDGIGIKNLRKWRRAQCMWGLHIKFYNYTIYHFCHRSYFLHPVSNKLIQCIMRGCLWCKWFGRKSCWLAQWPLRQQNSFERRVKDLSLSDRSPSLSFSMLKHLSGGQACLASLSANVTANYDRLLVP